MPCQFGCGTREGNRTPTPLRELDFESNASTDSATLATDRQGGDVGPQFRIWPLLVHHGEPNGTHLSSNFEPKKWRQSDGKARLKLEEAIRWQSCLKLYPAAWAANGSKDRGVMPGSVFVSK